MEHEREGGPADGDPKYHVGQFHKIGHQLALSNTLGSKLAEELWPYLTSGWTVVPGSAMANKHAFFIVIEKIGAEHREQENDDEGD